VGELDVVADKDPFTSKLKESVMNRDLSRFLSSYHLRQRKTRQPKQYVRSYPASTARIRSIVAIGLTAPSRA